MSTILITGANRGIGLSLTTLYAKRGDTVLACCRTPRESEALLALAKTQSVEELLLCVDSDRSVAQVAQQLSDRTIDIVINNAGIIGQPRESQTATNMDFAIWSDLLNVNTLGPARVMQALLPQLKRSTRPKVVNITSDLGAIAHDDPIFLGYSASKAALNKFMRLAAIELKPLGIAVGLIHPGWVKTDMGGTLAPVAPDVSATGIVKVIDQLSLANTGGFWQWDGKPHEW